MDDCKSCKESKWIFLKDCFWGFGQRKPLTIVHQTSPPSAFEGELTNIGPIFAGNGIKRDKSNVSAEWPNESKCGFHWEGGGLLLGRNTISDSVNPGPTQTQKYVCVQKQLCGKSAKLVLLNRGQMKACEAVDSLDKKVAIQNVTGRPPPVWLH